MAELQISLFTNDKDYSLFRNKVNTLMSRMDAIREELNEYLFFNPDDRPTINSPADIHKVVSPCSSIKVLSTNPMFVSLKSFVKL